MWKTSNFGTYAKVIVIPISYILIQYSYTACSVHMYNEMNLIPSSGPTLKSTLKSASTRVPELSPELEIWDTDRV